MAYKISTCLWFDDQAEAAAKFYIPVSLSELMSDPTRAERVTRAFMQMKKLDIEILQKA